MKEQLPSRNYMWTDDKLTKAHENWIRRYAGTLGKGLYMYCDSQQHSHVNPLFVNFCYTLRKLGLFHTRSDL